MQKALLSKELRECAIYAGIALLFQMHYLSGGMDLPLIPFLSAARDQEIPLLGYQRNREVSFTMVAVIAGIVLGLHQSMWESWRQTALYLLHRPMPRNQIFLNKLLAGVLLLIAVTALPLLIYCLWAAAPGTHASPFFWGFSEPWWRSVVMALVCYLGAFLTGLRPAYWIGSKTWPLVTTLGLSLSLKAAPIWSPLAYLGLAALAASLVHLILETARTREYP